MKTDRLTTMAVVLIPFARGILTTQARDGDAFSADGYRMSLGAVGFRRQRFLDTRFRDKR